MKDQNSYKSNLKANYVFMHAAVSCFPILMEALKIPAVTVLNNLLSVLRIRGSGIISEVFLTKNNFSKSLLSKIRPFTSKFLLFMKRANINKLV